MFTNKWVNMILESHLDATLCLYMSTKRLIFSKKKKKKFVLKNSNGKRVSFQIKSNQSEHEGVRKDTWDVRSSVDSFFLQKHVLLSMTLFSKVLYVIVIFCWDGPYVLRHNSSTYIGFSATDSPESIGNLQKDNLSKCIVFIFQ